MTPFILRLGGATASDAAALRAWGRGLAEGLTVLSPPEYEPEVPQENPEFVEAGAAWSLLVPEPDSREERVLLDDLHRVVSALLEFTGSRPHLEVGVQFGCCEIGYVEGGESDAGVAFVLDPRNWPSLVVHDHS